MPCRNGAAHLRLLHDRHLRLAPLLLPPCAAAFSELWGQLLHRIESPPLLVRLLSPADNLHPPLLPPFELGLAEVEPAAGLFLFSLSLSLSFRCGGQWC